MREQRIYEPIKYTYKPDEIRQLGETLARESQIMIDLKEQKANTAAAFQSELKAAATRMGELTVQINNGYEIRETECMFMLDTPRIGMKTLVRCDDPRQEIRMEAMTLEEQQQNLDLSEGEK